MRSKMNDPKQQEIGKVSKELLTARHELKFHKYQCQEAKKRIKKAKEKLNQYFEEDDYDTPAYTDEQMALILSLEDQDKPQKKNENEEHE